MASAANPQTRVRVAGSGFTIFTFAGQPISFCQQVQYTSPQFVGNGVSAIQPMDEPYAVELLTPAAAGPGSLTLNLFELFGSGGAASKVWDRLGAPIGSGTGSPFGGTGVTNGSIYDTPSALGASTNPFNGLVDIVDIAIAQAQVDPTQMQIVKYIRPLPTYGNTLTPYSEEYNGCVITNVTDGENVEVGTLEIIKQITVSFRYVTRNGKPSQAFALRDAAL
jgi:hypothetical protein